MEPHQAYHVRLQASSNLYIVLARAGFEATVQDKGGNEFKTKLPDLRLPVDPSFEGSRPREYVSRELTRKEWKKLCSCRYPFRCRRPCGHVNAHVVDFSRSGQVSPVPDVKALYDLRFFHGAWDRLWMDVGSTIEPSGLSDRVAEAQYVSDPGAHEGTIAAPLFVLSKDYRPPDARGSKSAAESLDAEGSGESEGEEGGGVHRRHGWGNISSNRRRLSIGETPRRGSRLQCVTTDVSLEKAKQAHVLKKFSSLGMQNSVSLAFLNCVWYVVWYFILHCSLACSVLCAQLLHRLRRCPRPLDASVDRQPPLPDSAPHHRATLRPRSAHAL